jgi:hypothetical protein
VGQIILWTVVIMLVAIWLAAIFFLLSGPHRWLFTKWPRLALRAFFTTHSGLLKTNGTPRLDLSPIIDTMKKEDFLR